MAQMEQETGVGHVTSLAVKVEKSQKLFLIWPHRQRYTYKVLQTIQMKLILLCVWAESAVLGSTETALKFKYEI